MSEKRFTESTETFDEFCDIIDNGVTIACMRKEYSKNIVNLLNSLAEQLLKTEKQNKGLKEENEQLKQKIQRWKTLYEIKDKEVTARVDGLNKVCEYYTSEVLFKSDVDPNKAVKEVINRILNTEVE